MEAVIKESMEKADDDQPDENKVIYARINNKLPAWMVIVVELTKALSRATDIEDFRTSFGSIIRDIENEIDSNRVIAGCVAGQHQTLV